MSTAIATRILKIVLVAAQTACFLRADGGALLMRQHAGPFAVSVFAAPPLPRVGPIDFSVLLQSPDSLTPVLDAQVEIVARDGKGVIVSRSALHDQAQNRLFYGAVLTLPHEGPWNYDVSIRKAATTATASGSLRVFPASSPLAAHWRVFSFPFVFLLLFTLHQTLAAGQRRQAVLQRPTANSSLG